MFTRILQIPVGDPIECLILVYVVCDACALGNLWMVIIDVSNLAVLMFCCFRSVCGVHKHLCQISENNTLGDLTY